MVTTTDRWLALGGLVGPIVFIVIFTAPTGVGRAVATYEIPVEGWDEWLAAARRPA
jgi:hypothetical protein